MSDVELRDELMTMLGAGHETTATGLAFAFDLLLRHPERARAPARRAGGGRRRRYLDAVVTETLRLRPVIDAAERTLTKPRTVARLGPAGRDPGLPGDRCSCTTARTSTREPERFRPERFLDGGAESYAWLPFGGGIRRCIGAALAQAEMAEVIRIVASRVESSSRCARSPIPSCCAASPWCRGTASRRGWSGASVPFAHPCND